MKRMVMSVILILVLMPLSALAEEVKMDGQCILSYKGRIYAQASCEGTILNKLVTEIKGIVPENGVSYQAIINDKKRTGVLLGAGTFVLADGPLEETTAGALYVWSNGYAIDFKYSEGK